MADAEWSMTVPTRHVDDDGSAIVVINVTDVVSGETGVLTVSLSAAREASLLVDGLTLTNFTAWSTK